MTLTFAQAPFAERPSGRFNFDRDAALPVLFWEEFPKRLRAEFDGSTVVDSRRVMALHETGKPMQLCVPADDVGRDLLSQAGDMATAAAGTVRCWALGKGGEQVAISFESPPPNASWLAGYFAFDLTKADAWFLEDEQGYAHPRDPYHRFDVLPTSREVEVRCGETVIARCATPMVLFETSNPPRFYLPPDAVRTDLLRRSDLVSPCPYKGPGQHWHLQVEAETIENAAWSLVGALDQAERIPGWYCFYPDKVDVLVDGERASA